MNSSRKALGILLLNTSFPRIPGDVGNPKSYSFPVLLKVVPTATVSRVVLNFDQSLIEAFKKSALELVEEGAIAITSSCGFLSVFQNEIARSVDVPVFLSSLIQIPLAYSITQRRIGILTAHSGKLTEEVLHGAGVSIHIPLAIRGLEDIPAFKKTILDGEPYLDAAGLEKEIINAAIQLKEEYPDIGCFVLECHNLAPYSHAIQKSTQLPVLDIIDFAEYVYSMVVKRDYPPT
ncbi:MAG: hypothetical protein ANABAC_2304 [Anaerolineae bacterium]|nr:MAG: hypothetical protein ANABAC_2304 [Anaerolineae bacterium]